MSKFGKIAGSISPLAGVMTGQGAYGKLAGLGALGPAAALVTPKRKKKDPLDPSGEAVEYKRGGKVKKSAKRRGDGCCVQGRTKGRMR